MDKVSVNSISSDNASSEFVVVPPADSIELEPSIKVINFLFFACFSNECLVNY